MLKCLPELSGMSLLLFQDINKFRDWFDLDVNHISKTVVYNKYKDKWTKKCAKVCYNYSSFIDYKYS